LTYYRNQDKSIATGNVKISDLSNLIIADTLTHFRKTNSVLRMETLVLKSEDNLTIFGDHLEDNGQLKYTLINKNPVLMQLIRLSQKVILH